MVGDVRYPPASVNPALKQRLLGALGALGVIEPAFRARESAKALSLRPRGSRSTNGFPLPPARLRVRVAGTAGLDWFLESGSLSAEAIRAALARAGMELHECRRVLDFGCGCGRVMRHWHDLGSVELHGSDRDRGPVGWCEANLPFASFVVHGAAPPLPYADSTFDAVCAISVFTHLAERDQRAWFTELRRTLVPGGVLVLTTHGDEYIRRLAPAERHAYEAGQLVVRWPQSSGRNLCTTFHPHEYVRAELTRGFDLIELAPNGAEGTPPQDLVVLRRES